MLERGGELSPKPSLLKAEQAPLSQPFLTQGCPIPIVVCPSLAPSGLATAGGAAGTRTEHSPPGAA